MDFENVACETPETASVEVDKPVRRRPRFRFLRRTVLVPLAVMAVLCSAWLGPVWLMLMTVIFASLAWPAVLIVVLVCGRGYQRAFCIAALYPAVGALVATGSQFFLWVMTVFGGDYSGGTMDDRGQLWFHFVVPLALSVACGVLGILVRWILTAHERC